MRKIITVLIGAASIALLLGVTACKELFADIEEDFSYWASEPAITNFRAASTVQTSPAGVQCVPSASDAVITLTVRNPKNFSFIMPGSGAPTDIVTFVSGIHDLSGTNPPAVGADYTLTQSGQNTLTLTYRAAFLKRYEQSSANIGASIKLYSTDGRKFNQIYSFSLEANTPPPDPAPVEAEAGKIALFKTRTPDSQGKHYYVLCFKVVGLPGENVLSGVPPKKLHGDLTHVYVSKNGGTETPCPVTLTTTDFNITNSGGTFIPEAAVDKLSGTEADTLSGSPQPDDVPSGPWVLYLKTDVPVGGVTAKYGIRLFDGKFYSARAEQTIGKRTLPDPKVFAHADIDNVAAFGVYTEATKIVTPGTIATIDSNDLNGGGTLNGSDETHAIPVYSAYGKAVKLTIKKPDGTDYPAGVTVRPGVQWVSGSDVDGSIGVNAGQSAVVTLPSPADAGGEAVYKVSFKASGEGFDDSATRTLYYKVRREIKAVNNLPMWYMLGAAIEKIDLDEAGTVKISGTIKAENIGYPPLPDGSLVENDSAIEVSGERDAHDYPGKTVTLIGDSKTSSILDASNLCNVFSIVYNGKLILKNVTLQNGKASGGYGGGISIGDNGSSCEMTDTDIKNCKVIGITGQGGALWVREGGSLTVGSGCVISANNAPNGKGAGIYVKSGGTFNISGNAKIDEGNDVYLGADTDSPYDPSKNAKITVNGELTGTHTVAKITPEDYAANRVIVKTSGEDISGYADRFKIADEPNSSPPPSTISWKLKYNGGALVLKQATTPIQGGTDTWKTLKEAIEAPTVEDGDEFVIQGTIKAIAMTGFHGAISVTKKITVKGESGSVLNANSNGTNRPPTPHRIFTVEDGGELTLKDITLTGGKVAGSGEGALGGGILVKAGGKAKLTNCTVKECGATGAGGGIYAEDGAEITLTNTQIKSCTADENGGGVYVKDSKLTLTNATIGGSTASDGNKSKRGGGIYIANGTLDVSAGSFIQHNQTAGSSGLEAGGGGIFIKSGKLTLNGTVSDNTALNGTAFVVGGGVYVVYGEFIMKPGATISGNTSKLGGGVYIDAYDSPNGGAGTFTMEGGEISGCTAGGPGFTDAAGGGVYINADGTQHGTFTMQGGTITGCTAEGTSPTGGGVYAKGGTVFKMSGSAVITPSTQTNTATKSFNDVYLDNDSSEAFIIVTDPLTSTPTVARLTMKDIGTTPGVDSGYIDGRVVVKGVKSAADAAKFKVTQQKATTPAQNWKVEWDNSNSGVLKPGP
ncbi:right-handed parallel beta-helix repeat-containing protein [Treponema parvum]|uniref:right-handed parallel beta-helix repeat-containing protein n=1 Tax=Treponema parvum TaxID=138851 RepID=UPI001AEC594C|nr:right-handed parallel beta-helix repeat-containing protein [Treponema parvum]QTQ16603.1 right-handed parallel beta-helix repeat-containing protein [Treponema parvum]